MRLILTVIWSFLLSEMLMYVGASMNGAAFNFKAGLIMTGVFTVAILLLVSTIPNTKVTNQHH